MSQCVFAKLKRKQKNATSSDKEEMETEGANIEAKKSNPLQSKLEVFREQFGNWISFEATKMLVLCLNICADLKPSFCKIFFLIAPLAQFMILLKEFEQTG